METVEFTRILHSLDGQLERVKKEADHKQKREAIEQHIKLVNHQISTLESRKAEFDKYGAKPPIDIEPILTRLRGERSGLEKQLIAHEEELITGEWRLSERDREEALALAEEVLNSDASQLPEVERWLWIEIWATRYRMLVERAGPPSAIHPVVKRTFAKIAEFMSYWKKVDVGWYIDALDKSKSGVGYNWPTRLEEARQNLLDHQEKRRGAEDGVTKALEGLDGAIAAFAQDKTADNLRSLSHWIRTAAKYDHLRDEVALMVFGWKDHLGREFDFLWPSGKVEEQVPAEDGKKIDNREFVRRILHRLRSKACIGGSHAPAEKMWKGFPNHDQAKAKDCLEMLVKAGVIRSKNTQIGERVSIEPGMVARVDAFFQGKDMGVKEVDEWVKEEALA